MQDDALQLFEFEWWKPDRGFVWKGEPKSQDGTRAPFLVVHPEATVKEFYTPIPLDEPANDRIKILFESFASLSASNGEILSFANTWGWLGIGRRINDKSGPGGSGESFEDWAREISSFRDAYSLWRWTDSPNSKGRIERSSKDCISIEIFRPSRPMYDSWTNTRRILFYRQEDARLFEVLDKRQWDALLAARAVLVQQVNKHLDGHASLRLLLGRNGHIMPQPSVRPRNLLTAIWVQLYQALLGWRVFRPCSYCKLLIDVTGCRSTKTTHWRCMNNQKMAKYRKNKRGPSGTKAEDYDLLLLK